MSSLVGMSGGYWPEHSIIRKGSSGRRLKYSFERPTLPHDSTLSLTPIVCIHGTNLEVADLIRRSFFFIAHLLVLRGIPPFLAKCLVDLVVMLNRTALTSGTGVQRTT